MIQKFIEKLESGYWKVGNSWEFDWYLDVFFCEVMAYGTNPIKIGYLQPVLGDSFLDFSEENKILNNFRNFFKDGSRVNRLITNQKHILSSANKTITNLKRMQFDATEYEKVQKDLSLLMASVSVIFDHLIATELKQIATAYGFTESSVVNYVVDHSSHTKLGESNKELLNIYKKHNGKVDKVKKDLLKHKEKYGWLNTGERGSNEWDENDFYKQLLPLISKNTSLQNTSLPWLLRLKLSPIVRISLNDNIAADRQVELDFLFQKYLRARLGEYYIESIVENLTYEEILEVLQNPKRIEFYEDRRNNTMRLVWPVNNSLQFYYFKTKKEYDSVLKKVQEKKTKNLEIKGMVACKGKVEGIVRIIKTQKDLNDFRPGEILVATQTQPKYVVVMTKAKAIVTDVGGVTSHAAIISREFEIPCVVGTRNATKVLKNGNRVLVDAENGVVTKLTHEK